MGCVFIAVPLAVFAPEHFHGGPSYIQDMAPSWMPARSFCPYRSIIERERRNAVKAADLLSPAMQYEATLDLFYQRAQAYLAARLYAKAAVDFNELLSRRGWNWWQVYAPLARLGLARTYAMQGDCDNSRQAYDDFFTTWKGADPDIPILRQAKAEYKALSLTIHANRCAGPTTLFIPQGFNGIQAGSPNGGHDAAD